MQTIPQWHLENLDGFCVLGSPYTPAEDILIEKMGLHGFHFNSILLPKFFWPTVRKLCSSDWEKLLEFDAEGREFANILRSLNITCWKMIQEKNILLNSTANPANPAHFWLN